VIPTAASTGRNFDEVLRVIDSLQLTAQHKVSTPAQWTQGEDVIIAGSVSDEEAKTLFGTWQAPKPYLRIVPQPQCWRGGLTLTPACPDHLAAGDAPWRARCRR
jgi:hypothetical protein